MKTARFQMHRYFTNALSIRKPGHRMGAVLGSLLLLSLVATPAWSDPVDIDNDPETRTRTELASWIGADGKPLPFESHDEVLDFLRNAPVVKKKVLDSGSTQPWKVTLERGGIRANAIFRHVDINENERSIRQFRDWHAFEVAAYEVDRMLHLGHVPPAALRELEGRQGSIQLWVENARSETERMEADGTIENMGKHRFQKYRMEIFDTLISNFDRNTGNQLIDASGKLWFIDHTRSFRRLSTLGPDTIKVCERPLWERLKALDREHFEQKLAPYLDTTQLNAFERRHGKLVKRLQNRIDEMGEAAVIIETDAGSRSEATP